MKQKAEILVAALLFWLFQACNTLYYTSLIDMEVVEPAKVIFPADVHKIAVKYNNSNVSYNPQFARNIDSKGSKMEMETKNTDSIASLLYFQSFVNTLNQSFIFDSIYVTEPGNYSKTTIELPVQIARKKYSTELSPGADMLAQLHFRFNKNTEPGRKKIRLHPELGLYTTNELQQIRASTGADLLLSLDYFALIEKHVKGTDYIKTVLVMPAWNFYNLNKKELQYFYHKPDTIHWLRYIEPGRLNIREETVQIASERAGVNFAQYLVPHWVAVKRTFYLTGYGEMKKAQKLAEENKWLEAAQIWKKNVANKNSRIAAKSMYNLAVACEMEGEIDAAIDWVVKSYQVFGNKNKVHEFNCRDYLQLLARRKLDFKKIEMQVNPE